MVDEKTEALTSLIKTTIEALGDERSKPFEIEAYYEYISTDTYDSDEICPRVRLIKK